MNLKDILKSKSLKKFKKIELLKEHYPEEFLKIQQFTKNDDEILSCFRQNIFEEPICQHPNCNNIVKMNKSNIFPKGCCSKHSQEITFLEKYNCTNPMKSDEVKNKLKLSNLEKYGFENPLQVPEIRERVSKTHKEIYKDYQKKVQETNLKKYGFKNPLQNKEIHKKSTTTKRVNNYYNRIMNFPNIEPLFDFEDYKGVGEYRWKCKLCNNEFSFVIEDGHIPICRVCNPFEKNPYSKGEKELVQFLKTFNLKIEENNRKILNGRELDIFIPDKNLAIEYNGIYWHTESKGKDKYYHLRKSEDCEKKGIELIHIFDKEYKEKENIIKALIKDKIGIYDKEISSLDCEIKKIQEDEINCFLEENHIDGKVENSEINLGMFFQNNLVSAISLQRLSNNSYKINRFCNKLNFDIKSSLNQFLNFVLNEFRPNEIIAYNDRRFNFIDYEKLGFQKIGITEPELCIINKIKIEKIWDCGKNKFAYKHCQRKSNYL